MRALALILLCVWASTISAADGGHAGHGRGSMPDESSWTDLPLIETLPGRGRSTAAFRLSHLAASAVTAYAPGPQAPLPEGMRFKTDRLEWEIPVQEGCFTLQAAGIGNYHWLQARKETPDSFKVASTAHFFSNPGPAPTGMLARSKTELEIVPTPLPREHNQYRENQERTFLLRFQGQPLAGATLRFVSDAGTQSRFISDASGRVNVRFPNDVKPAQGQSGHDGHGQPTTNRFVLAVEHEDQGRHYLTAFNYRYSEDAYARRSLLWGSSFLVLGGLLGLPLVVRRKENHHG